MCGRELRQPRLGLGALRPLKLGVRDPLARHGVGVAAPRAAFGVVVAGGRDAAGRDRPAGQREGPDAHQRDPQLQLWSRVDENC